MEVYIDKKGRMQWPKKLSVEAIKFCRRIASREKWLTTSILFDKMIKNFHMDRTQDVIGKHSFRGKNGYGPIFLGSYVPEFLTILRMEKYEAAGEYIIDGRRVMVYIKKKFREKVLADFPYAQPGKRAKQQGSAHGKEDENDI